ncbi:MULTISPECIES: aminotransferase class I/II-fold pyridoxal phosphate-dependent enzyme [Psychrobacter]|jgi:alanine-synthesizing transaminase|uniref:aminotransferase class I/II-fold pyridoxal phosphate-dependent enzyme n=1 Tax=Psychrobacter sp. B29-1 TaxID=1867800 RepID=UPI000869A10D|nr:MULTISPECIES: aminotransferase class I/II-fold pyridoxal phosphate-dependent enzyme [Psychrobacter]MBA6243106.1 aminotransferase class I/II-fold pyridoxal phosphate-dependent enzyme [Psychrobacter sp. Urea-trap-18]MBA6284679.1 aminotransferase class I/II-fold pyridoxal phosphate-dependent enzyme [Psychrobacter sp. Urea-trap-16]MBA6317980.1 aminotransferase class I/II-fold pyridoxal phosphate-dependent enzyme [Psychrobacter sp. Urea-trap-20]MBA6333420.1 aminotransferase class I/II-fold pyrido|tara:strand:+ start:1703 stop:3355 length:1653 start_codon:yes stop_codon:yes gene_type:complete
MSDDNGKGTQAERLVQLRRDKGFTAEQLAQAMTAAGAKVSRGAISNWERGTNGIVSSKLPTLARILGCSEGYLLRGDLNNEAIDADESTSSVERSEHQKIDTISHTQSDIKITDAQSTTPYSASKKSKTNSTTNPKNGHAMNTIKKSDKLQNVCYDIRGPLLQTANKMEAEGKRILKLNVGNPAPFGLEAPHEILRDVAMNLSEATGYSDSQGIFSARKAILQYYQSKGLLSAVDVRDVYLGNGVSELIVMTMQALMNDGDEVLIPMPDYPLWTAAANLAGGTAVHYRCNEEDNWHPDIEDIKSKITSKTKGIVVINPNNPTGSLYSDELLKQIIEVAKEHDLIIMADEIYDRILYDDNVHTPMGTLTDDVLVLSYNGLSKSHRIAGFRSGWMMVSGRKQHAADFIEGLDMLASMRLCSNVQGQYAIQTAMGGHQSMQDLTSEKGRLYKQREMAVSRLNAIKGISCTMPQGAFYCFPKMDPEVYPITDDMDFMMDLLVEENVLMVQGTGFNWDRPDHFRLVFLPNLLDLENAMDRLDRFFAKKRKQFGTE